MVGNYDKMNIKASRGLTLILGGIAALGAAGIECICQASQR